MTATEKRVVSRKEACEMYSISPATLRRAEQSGALRAKTVGGRRRYRVADLDAWFDGLDDA